MGKLGEYRIVNDVVSTYGVVKVVKSCFSVVNCW